MSFFVAATEVIKTGVTYDEGKGAQIIIKRLDRTDAAAAAACCHVDDAVCSQLTLLQHQRQQRKQRMSDSQQLTL